MNDEYIHGFTEAEQQRLTRLQSILNQRQLAAMNLDGVGRLLDVGSGLGQLTRAMARRLPKNSTVIGIERDERQLQEAARQAAQDGEPGLVEFRCGSAEDPPLQQHEWGSFDLVHSRFVLEHVTDPLAVVRQMVASVRPGGQLFLLDDDHAQLRIWPECKELMEAWSIYWHSYRDLGCDPLIGRRLVELLNHAGATACQIGTIFYGATSSDEIFDAVVENLIGVIDSAADQLAQTGKMSKQQWLGHHDRILDWRSLPSATVWYSLPFATALRPTDS